MITRAIRLLLASGFLAAVAHVAPVAERAALGITRVEDLAPEAIARPLGKIRAACRIDRLSHRLESPSESGDACGLREPSSDAHAQPPGTLPNPALTPGAVRTTSRASPGAVPVMLSPGLSLGRVMSSACRPAPSSSLGRGDRCAIAVSILQANPRTDSRMPECTKALHAYVDLEQAQPRSLLSAG
jgi:hypothetical protein